MTLKNTGHTLGAEAVQLYVGKVASGKPAKLIRAPKELKGFQKVALKPGTSQKVSFELASEAFRYWDIETHAWKVEAGTYAVFLGSSSRDIRASEKVVLK
jgi:beta-glucosidase